MCSSDLSEIEDTITTLDAGAIQYSVDAFYMAKLDGDKAYADIKSKIKSGTPLTKQDLMSIVFLPLMKNSVARDTRLEQAITLSKTLSAADEQVQIQAMLEMLAEKFVTDKETLRRLKELIGVGILTEMVVNDKMVEVAKSLLRDGMVISAVVKHTGLTEETVHELQAEIDNE